jgi:hypothetical protein
MQGRARMRIVEREAFSLQTIQACSSEKNEMFMDWQQEKAHVFSSIKVTRRAEKNVCKIITIIITLLHLTYNRTKTFIK